MTEHSERSLIHLVQRPRAVSDKPPMLVLLHGYGSNEHDLFSLAQYLDPRLVIVSARAPYALMPGSYAWFELGFTPGGITVDPGQAELSRTHIVRLVEEAIGSYGASPAKVLLGGFSQGAMMAAAVALSRPDLISGAILMSGMVPRELLTSIARPEQLAGMPILMVHGTYDQVLPVQFGRAGRDLLRTLPVDLAYHEYPMAHEVSMASLRDLADWLSARLDDSQPRDA